MRQQQLLDLHHSSDLPTYQKQLVAFAGELGFGLLAATVIADELHSRAFKTLHNAPSSFAEEVTANGEDAKRDPVLQRVLAFDMPFFWDQDTYVQAGAADLWDKQAVHGYKSGIAVSIRIPGGKRFMLGFDRDAPLPQRDEDRTRMLADLQLAAVYAQSPAIQLMLASPEAPKLTPRQVEILRWSSIGKTISETAQILGISARGVSAQLSKIFEKLDVTSQKQAVAKAAMLGLI